MHLVQLDRVLDERFGCELEKKKFFFNFEFASFIKVMLGLILFSFLSKKKYFFIKHACFWVV